LRILIEDFFREGRASEEMVAVTRPPGGSQEMIIGDPSVFAIESVIAKAYERPSFRALGFFAIHVDGKCYGVRKPDATMLACSFDEVEQRIPQRGRHTAPFADEPDAGKIADAFRNAIYADEQSESYFGIPLLEFQRFLAGNANDLVWAPDGDEAFDDGSYVLQFDIGEQVRLIAFRCKEGGRHDPASIRDVRITADDFYHTLQQWHEAFKAEWASSPKIRGT
jgi:hypothetical protein